MSADRLVMEPPVRQPQPKQTAAEDQRVYDAVTARDVTCRAPVIDPRELDLDCIRFNSRIGRWQNSPLERHHTGNTIGSKRITDARHVVLLCEWHHRTWAPTHSRLILAYLARVEDAHERARHDADEDARELLAEKLRGDAREEALRGDE